MKLAKRTLTNLYSERPAWLVHAHAKLDAAVAAAYDFPVDLTNAAKQRSGKKISRVKSEHEMI